MKVYWKERRAGQRLMLCGDDESEVEVGAVRQTRHGYDALAKTNTYDPGRAQKGFETIDEAKSFVESFHPWDIFGGDWDLEVEPDVRPAENEASAGAADEPTQDSTPADDSPQADSGSGQEPPEENQPRNRGWKFWGKG